MLWIFLFILAIVIGTIYAFVDHDGAFAFLGVLIGGVIFLFGNMFGSAFNDTTNVIETQKNVTVSLKVVNDKTAYVWVYNGRQFSVPVDNERLDPYTVFTKVSNDKIITIEKYEDNKFWTVFGPKSDDTIFRISTGTLAK